MHALLDVSLAFLGRREQAIRAVELLKPLVEVPSYLSKAWLAAPRSRP